MKSILSFLLFLIVISGATIIHGQTFTFPTVNSPASCANTYTIDITVRLDSVQLTNIYFDDGTNGSFAYEARVSYQNSVTNSTLPPGNFYTYEISLYSDNPNLTTPVLTNNIGNVPWQTGAAGGLASQNNPTYNGSASAMGLSLGQYYNSPSLLATLGYDSATIRINLPCLDTLIRDGDIVPLPIIWSKLMGNVQGSDIVLSWQTFMERDNAGFRIERSTDAKNWDILNHIPTKANGGNSNTALSYIATTREHTTGTYYYRVIQQSRDGKAMASNIFTANINTISKSSANVFPNPSATEAYFSGLNVGSEYALFDIYGRVVQQGKYGGRLDVSEIEQGTYFVRSGTETVKIVVSR